MRKIIQVEIDHEIVDKLTKHGDDRGWTLEETIRYILGREISMTTLTPFSLPAKLTKEEDPTVRAFASMVASQRVAKCKNCLKELTADEILDGKCSECEEKI